MSHINFSLPKRGEVDQNLRSILQAEELRFWKSRAEYLEKELQNIPEALKEFGEWYIRDQDGQSTHVILDPERHTKDTP